MNSQHQSISLDIQLRTLSAAERREVLHTLSAAKGDEGGAVDIEQFTDAADPDTRLSMHHVHLPNLEDAKLIRVDRDANRIQRGPNFDDIEPLLRLIDDHANELPVDWP